MNRDSNKVMEVMEVMKVMKVRTHTHVTTNNSAIENYFATKGSSRLDDEMTGKISDGSILPPSPSSPSSPSSLN